MANDGKARPGRLTSKVALVTGAGPGLGGVIASAMADEGARLVVCDIDPAALQVTQARLEAQGRECLALRCDVSDSAAVDAMFAQAADRFGGVDILVNNAARVPSAPAEEARRNRHYRGPGCDEHAQPRLLGDQGRRDQPDQDHGAGCGGRQHLRQRDRLRRRADAAIRGLPRARQRRALGSALPDGAAWPHRPGRGVCLARSLPRSVGGRRSRQDPTKRLGLADFCHPHS